MCAWVARGKNDESGCLVLEEEPREKMTKLPCVDEREAGMEWGGSKSSMSLI